MLNSYKNKIALIISAVAFLIAAFNFSNWQSVKQNLTDAKNQRAEINNQIEYYKKLQNDAQEIALTMQYIFHKSSDAFYSENPIIFLTTGADYEDFIIHNNNKVPASYDILNQNFYDSDNAANICSDIKVEVIHGFNEENEAKIRVTSGSTVGYNVIQFYNSSNDEKFYVLIMVVRED